MNRPRFAPRANNNSNRNENYDLLLIRDMMFYHSNICYRNNELFGMILNY